MSKLTIFVSATIVLILHSAPSGAAPQAEVPPQDVREEAAPMKELDENMAITEPPPAPRMAKPTDPRYYAYRQAVTLRAGFGLDLSAGSEDVQRVLGVQYLMPRFLSPRIELGADLHNDGNGHIHAGLRRVFNERGYFRPSLKAGLDHLLESEKNMASFAHINNYFLQTTGTMEWVVWNPYSIRLEQELLFGLRKTWTVTTLGISRGW